MSIVKSKNKKTGVTYVYESESYWDKEKKQPRNRRKLIGKLDEAGNIIPTGRQGRRKKEGEADTDPKQEKDMMDSLAFYRDKCRELETECAILSEQVRILKQEKGSLLSGMEELIKKNR